MQKQPVAGALAVAGAALLVACQTPTDSPIESSSAAPQSVPPPAVETEVVLEAIELPSIRIEAYSGTEVGDGQRLTYRLLETGHSMLVNPFVTDVEKRIVDDRSYALCHLSADFHAAATAFRDSAPTETMTYQLEVAGSVIDRYGDPTKVRTVSFPLELAMPDPQ